MVVGIVVVVLLQWKVTFLCTQKKLNSFFLPFHTQKKDAEILTLKIMGYLSCLISFVAIVVWKVCSHPFHSLVVVACCSPGWSRQ